MTIGEIIFMIMFMVIFMGTIIAGLVAMWRLESYQYKTEEEIKEEIREIAKKFEQENKED